MVSRKARRRRVIAVTGGLLIVAVGSALWLRRDPLGLPNSAASSIAPARTVRELQQWAARIQSGRNLAQADGALAGVLLDPRNARRPVPTGRRGSTSAEEWFTETGADRVLPHLLSRFRSGSEEVSGHEFLSGLNAAFPELCARIAGGKFAAAEALARGETPVWLCRAVSAAHPLTSPYLLFQLEECERSPGALLSLVLLQRLSVENNTYLRERIERILRRLPDAQWRRLLAERRRHDPSFRGFGDRWRSEGTSGTNLADPAEDVRTRRRQFIARGLASGEETSVLNALERFRWDPVSELDASVLRLAGEGSTRRIRRAAVLALRGVTRKNWGAALTSSLRTPERSDEAFRVLHEETGHEWGGFAGRWDHRQPVSAAASAIERWRACVAALAPSSRVEAVHTVFREGRVDLAHRRWVPLLADRGDLDVIWYRHNGRLLVAGLDGRDPDERRATLRALTRWESAAALPILARRFSAEEDPAVQSVFIDTILELGGGEGARAALNELAAADHPRGLNLVEAYGLAFPGLSVVAILRDLAQDERPGVRAGAAYLFAGLAPTAPHAAPLLRLLSDPDERCRFWADRSLEQMFREDPGFEPARSPAANARAIREWYSIVRRRSGDS